MEKRIIGFCLGNGDFISWQKHSRVFTIASSWRLDEVLLLTSLVYKRGFV